MAEYFYEAISLIPKWCKLVSNSAMCVISKKHAKDFHARIINIAGRVHFQGVKKRSSTDSVYGWTKVAIESG